MTEVTAKYKLFLAVGMVVTGTLNTISTKERFQFDARYFHWLIIWTFYVQGQTLVSSFVFRALYHFQ